MIVSLFTPEGLKYSGEVNYIEVMDKESGSFGILENHCPIVSAISVGYVMFRDVNNKETYYALSGALLEQKNNHIRIVSQIFEVGDTKEEAKKKLENVLSERRNENRKRNIELAQAEKELVKQIKKSGAGHV